MTVKDVMTLLESPDRVRVIKDGEEIYNQYFANMQVDKDIVAADRRCRGQEIPSNSGDHSQEDTRNGVSLHR